MHSVFSLAISAYHYSSVYQTSIFSSTSNWQWSSTPLPLPALQLVMLFFNESAFYRQCNSKSLEEWQSRAEYQCSAPMFFYYFCDNNLLQPFFYDEDMAVLQKSTRNCHSRESLNVINYTYSGQYFDRPWFWGSKLDIYRYLFLKWRHELVWWIEDIYMCSRCFAQSLAVKIEEFTIHISFYFSVFHLCSRKCRLSCQHGLCKRGFKVDYSALGNIEHLALSFLSYNICSYS